MITRKEVHGRCSLIKTDLQHVYIPKEWPTLLRELKELFCSWRKNMFYSIHATS